MCFQILIRISNFSQLAISACNVPSWDLGFKQLAVGCVVQIQSVAPYSTTSFTLYLVTLVHSPLYSIPLFK